jgi:hypothetical protein
MDAVDLSRMERRLAKARCEASDNGGVELLEAASYSTGKLADLLSEYSTHKSRLEARRQSAVPAEPRGSRCSCAACAADYRVMAALG